MSGELGRGKRENGATLGSTVIIIIMVMVISIVGSAASAPAGTAASLNSGTLFFTQIGGGVGKVSFAYDQSAHTFSLTNLTMIIRALPGGADGLVLDPLNGNLLVGVNGGGPALIHVVDPLVGKVVATIGSGTKTPYHLMIDPRGATAWTSGEPGVPSSIPLDPLGNGTAHPVSGDDKGVDTIAWKDQSHAYYTSSGIGGYGHFGTIDLQTFTTSCVKASSGGCQTFPAAHGMAFDPFTGTLIMFGDSQITQIDPPTLSILSNRTVNGATFDQGTVDGKGHLFVASNGGTLFFEDYSTTGRIGAAGSYFKNPFLIGSLDDVAPLIGPGTSSSLNLFLGPTVAGAVGITLIVPMVILIFLTIRGTRRSLSKN